MKIDGVSAGVDLSFLLGETGYKDEWTLIGSGISIDLDASFDKDSMFWGKLRLFYNTAGGKVENGDKLASIDDLNFGFGLLAGMNLVNEPDWKLSLGVGFGLGFGIMDVGLTDKGSEKLDPTCPTFNEIVEDPAGIKCYFDGMDGSYSNKRVMAEASFQYASVFLSPFFEWEINSKRSGQLIPENLYRFGIKGGMKF